MKNNQLKIIAATTVMFCFFSATIAIGAERSAGMPVQKADRLIITLETAPTVSSDADVESAMQNLYDSSSDEEYAAAVAAIQKMADARNAEAAFRLAMFFHLESPWKDYKQAFALYQVAIKQGHAWAINNLGLMYENGASVPADMDKAIEMYKLSAEKGEPRGYINMARLYFLGKGVEKNIALGVEWGEKGGAKGFPLAYNELSQVFCCKLYDVPQDMEKSTYYRQKAAELGDTEAQWNVAQRYLEGNGVPQDAQYGTAMMERLAVENNSDALNSLGTTYARGRGVAVDKEKALQYWLQAAELGNCRSMMNLADAYDNGWGVAINHTQATAYIQKAVQCNNPPEAFDLWKLAKRYHRAEGVAQDCNKAIDLYTRAADLGQIDAFADLGYLYQNGCGKMEADIKQAFASYLQGAKLGNAVCQNNVGSLLDRGAESIPRDRIRAYAWFLLSMENTSETATKNLIHASYTLNDEDIKKAENHLAELKSMLKNINPEQLVDETLY